MLAGEAAHAHAHANDHVNDHDSDRLRDRSRARARARARARTLFATAAALLQIACNPGLAAPIAARTTDEVTPKKGGTIRFATFADIRTLDPAASAEMLGAGAVHLIYAGLVDYDAHGNVAPDIASRWEVSADRLTHRFFLRESVRFHDGSELTADDIKRSIERALHPSTPCPFASFFESIDGFTDYTQNRAPHITGLVVESPHVVSIRLARPDATFLQALGLPNIRPVCRSAGARYSDAWAPCGAGPFKVEPGGWEHGRSLTIVRHGEYFREGLPHVDSATWTFGMARSTERFKFDAGEIDALRDLSEGDLRAYMADPRWKKYGRYDADVAMWGERMDVTVPPFDNVEVRRAVAAAINREHYALLKPGTIRPLNQVLPPDANGHDRAFRGQKYDYKAALDHMARAGFPYDPKTKKGGYPHPIPYYAYSDGFSEQSAQVLQQELAKIGITLDIHLVNYATYLAITQRRGRAAFAPAGWSQDFPDPSDFFESMFATKSINADDSVNSTFYSNPALDRLLEQAHSEPDRAKRLAMYGEANRIVCDDAPMAFTHSARSYELHQPYLKGYAAHPMWLFNVTEAWLDK